MRVTQYDKDKFRIHRDHWTEWLWFKVSYEARTRGLPIPKFYSVVHKIDREDYDVWNYYFIPIMPLVVPIIYIYKFIYKQWYLCARWFKLHNMLDKEEGACYPKFWPAYLHWPRK